MFTRFSARRWTSLLTALALLFTLLPVQPAVAADSIQFDELSTEINSPTQKNTSIIEVSGVYLGVAAATLTYTVEQIDKDGNVISTTPATGITPILEGSNRFRFINVEIGAGLNKITVSGVSSNNTVVSRSAYVLFPNAPSIYNVQLADGRKLEVNKPIIVTTSEITLLMEAPNATNVTVQGIPAFSGGSNTFLAANIPVEPGLNTLVFTASNTTNTYSITRDVIFYDGVPTLYNVAMEFDDDSNPATPPHVTKLDGNPTVGPNSGTQLRGNIAGYIAVEKAAGNPPLNMEIAITRNNVNVTGSPATATVTHVEDVTVTGAVYDFSIYSFSTSSAPDFEIGTSGDYVLQATGTYGSTNINFPLHFKYRSGNNPIINEVRQLHNVTEPASPTGQVQYTSTSLFTSNQTFFQLPIWIAVRADNFDAGDVATLSTSQGNVIVGPPAFAYTDYTNSMNAEDDVIFKITSLPAGEQTLILTLRDTATNEEDVWEISLSYIPTPYIQFHTPHNNKEFQSASEFTEVSGRFINFNLSPSSPDRDSLKLTINGAIREIRAANPAVTIDYDTGEFTYTIGSDTALHLVNGPNQITIEGTASGVPVSTSITVFLFPVDLPQITQLVPRPVGQSTDPDEHFKSAGDLNFTTTEKRMDVVFTVAEASEAIVYIDGQYYTKASKSPSDPMSALNPEDPAKMGIDNTTGTTRTFRLHSIALPDSGTMNVTITAAEGASSVSRTLSVTRTRVPYTILSPKLPHEQIVNQNFITVSIRAEGADSIVINKQEMVKDSTDDIFRLTIDNLKVGNNPIKFTITTGDSKVDGQFTVTYAAQNIVGAQYKTTIPNSGKLSVFGGALTLSFPKGTMLRQPITGSSPNTPQIELFNSQKLLFGIADPYDGRTVKRYNQVGEVSGNQPLDGQLRDIPMDGNARNFLQNGRSHFGYASPLYWIDAGYFITSSVNNDYRTVDGLHPYASNNMFYIRGQNKERWLLPTNRGEIVIKYDPNIRNEAARNLSIWRFDGTSWKNLGGVVNTSRKTVTASFDGFGYYAVMALRYGFQDITGHSFARNHLETMFAKGIMEPKASNVFGVYDNITRGEFATMIVRILDLPLNYEDDQLTFNDVPPVAVPGALWDYRYIETAARAGIISGMAPRVFNPNGLLTREQAATIIARALEYKIGNNPEADRNKLDFVDAGQIDYYAVSYVLAITKDKIMSGRLNPLEEGQRKPTYSFDPKAYLSRAEMAVIAYNIMSKKRRI